MFHYGRPCPYGHDGKRYTSNATCVTCQRTRGASQSKTAEFRAYHKRWRDANKDKVRGYLTNDRAKYPERVRETGRRWAKARPDLVKAKGDRWRARHPERARENMRAQEHKRRARLKTVVGSFTGSEALAIYKRQGYCCAACRADLRGNKKQLDHIVPISRGGTNFASNLQWLCAHCNRSKWAKLMSEWIAL